MSGSAFGPFADVFERGELAVPGHLELLGLDQPGAQIVIDRIQRALTSGPAQPFVDALFAQPNWRAHLVGAVALVLDDRATLASTSLWHAIDAGSWVLPQLVVCAYVIDPDFPARCRERIRVGAKVSPPLGLSPVERHSATGPSNTLQRSAKLLVSLATIGRRVPLLADWIETECARPELASLISQDVDRAAAICEQWLGQLLSQFERRGVDLVPAGRGA